MGAGGKVNSAQGGHETVYRSLLRIYPADYRRGFGDQMVQLFGDQRRDEGTARSWLRALIDLPRSATAEHLRRNRTVAHSMTLSPTPASRLLGLLGVVGGAALLIAFLGISISPDLFNLRLALFNLGAIAVIIAVHQRHAHAGKRLALAGAIPAVAANAAYLVLIVSLVAQPSETGQGGYGPFIGYAAGAMWLSDAWFGLVTLRLGVLSRWSAMALVGGSLFALAGMGQFGLVDNPTIANIILVGVAVHGLAWILLGLEVALRRRVPLTPA